jgi:hypothetical protein
MWLISVVTDFRNLRRAGVLKNSCFTVIIVPGGAPVSDTFFILPPSEPGYGGNAGQCFAPESQGVYGKQIPVGVYFARRIAFKGQQGIIVGHPDAIIGNADECPTAFFDFDNDAPAVRIQGIFNQFLDH